MNTLQADELGMKWGDGAKTPECQLLVWSVSLFILLCTSFCSSYPRITLMLLHIELELSMLLKCSRIPGLSLSKFHLTFVFMAPFLQAKRDPRGTSVHVLTQKKNANVAYLFACNLAITNTVYIEINHRVW